MTGSLRNAIVGVTSGLLLAVATSANAAPINLVANGDFSAGLSGFTTDYGFQGDDLGSDRDLWDPGIFGLDDSAEGRHTLWTTTHDHTSGSGTMMLVNGQTTSASTVWRQTVNVDANQNYFFEAWAMNLCCNTAGAWGDSGLGFYINGVLLGSNLTSGSGLWNGLSNTWFSAGATLATLEIRNSSTIFSGNDFALDDLFLGTESSLNPTPEPASMLLLLTGIPVARAAYRRRQAKRQQGC